MDGELRAAITRLDERMHAARIVRPEHATPEGRESLIAAARAIFSGTDLDYDELAAVATERTQEVLKVIALHGVVVLPALISGVYTTALRTGLLIAEARDRAEASA